MAVRVFIASSLDGFIAGEDDDLSWLGDPDGPAEPVDHGYDAFFAEIGALLMGRGTYDVVEGFDKWPYEDRPVLVATHRPLEPKVDTVRAVRGDVEELLVQAQEAAGDRDVYLDGGNLIRQALDAGRVDELTVSFIPVVLGRGIPLFAGAERRHRLDVVSHRLSGQLVQVTYRPRRIA